MIIFLFKFHVFLFFCFSFINFISFSASQIHFQCIHTFFFCFSFLSHSNPILNHPLTLNSLQSATPSPLRTSDGSETVGATFVDKLNTGVDKLLHKFLSPYLGHEDEVDFFNPKEYYYLPPQNDPSNTYDYFK